MIINRQRRVRLDVKSLEDFLGRVQGALRLSSREVTVCLVSDATMARMNRAFRHKPGPTDVLSFPANGPSARQGAEQAGRRRKGRRLARNAYLGDIAISPETAQRNARRLARTLPQELRVLILHGMLHLAGYDHETDHGEMDRLERKLRRPLGLT
jgi:probable rRNA maturation factor